MRKCLFPLSVAWLISSSLSAGAQTEGNNYSLAAAGSYISEPEFMDGQYMNAHLKKTIIKNIVEIKKHVMAGSPDAGINDKKFTVVNNQIVLINSEQQEPGDTIHTNSQHINEIADPSTAVRHEKQALNETKIEAVTITDAPVENAAGEEEVMEPVITKYAEMISVDPAEITNYPLYRFIDDWYGTRYHWGGDDKNGIDCSAFSQKLYRIVYGVDIVRTAREQHRMSERIRHYDEANEGDLVFFRIHRLRISHVGIYLANGYFVHASRSKGVTISNLDSRYWRNRYAGCGRIARAEKASESDFMQ